MRHPLPPDDVLFSIFRELMTLSNRERSRVGRALCQTNRELGEYGKDLLYGSCLIKLDVDPSGSFLIDTLSDPTLARRVRTLVVQTWDSSISAESFELLQRFWRCCNEIRLVEFSGVLPHALERALTDLSLSPAPLTLTTLTLGLAPSHNPPDWFSLEVLEVFKALQSITFTGGRIGEGTMRRERMELKAMRTVKLLRCEEASFQVFIDACTGLRTLYVDDVKREGLTVVDLVDEEEAG